MRSLYITILLLLSAKLIQAQFIPDYRRAADVYFANEEYYAAATYYKKALFPKGDSLAFSKPYAFELNSAKGTNKNSISKEYLVYQLAEATRLYKDFGEAEKWYKLASKSNNGQYPKATFWYAESLRANNKFEEAILIYQEFIDANEGQKEDIEKATLSILSCKFALNQMRSPSMVSIRKLKSPVNSTGSNYAPLLKGDKFYFTSSRPVDIESETYTLNNTGHVKVKQKNTPYLNGIYELEGKPESTSIVKRLSFETNAEYATTAFSKDGSTMYFTRWVSKDKEYQVFYIDKVDGEWQAPEKLAGEINLRGFNAMQPFVTANGKFLLFSSNRPGGFGKNDIWYCTLTANGMVGNPINLGSEINTVEDDEAPYYDVATQKLLFSSKGRIGLGGFDFYESTGDFTNWSPAVNMGYPFNSSKDDLYYTPAEETGAGYISSDRESTCCLELFYIKKDRIAVNGVLINCDNGQPLEGVTVIYKDSLDTQEVKTKADGFYTFELDEPKAFSLRAEKDGYFSKNLKYLKGDVLKVDTLVSPELCLKPFEIKKPIVLKDIYYDFNSANLRPESLADLNVLVSIMNDNPKVEIEIGSHTDDLGSDKYNNELSKNRAQSCVDYLIAMGVATERIVAKGYGESTPIAPNQIDGKDNPEGRQLNRRTEFKVTKK